MQEAGCNLSISCKGGKPLFWEPCGIADYLEELIQDSSLLYLLEGDNNCPPGQELITDMDQLKRRQDSIVYLPLLSKKQSKEVILAGLQKLQGFSLTGLVLVVDPLLVDKSFLLDSKAHGASQVILPMDIAGKQLFKHYHRISTDDLWLAYWEALEEAVAVFGSQKVSVNLFAGLGETEEEFISMVQIIDDAGAETSIFSARENKALGIKPCSIGKYRRLQMGRYLIHRQLTTIRQMQFNQFGSVFEYGIHPKKLEELLENGTPFHETGGSLHYWPGHDNGRGGIRNYPQPLDADEAQKAKQEFFAVSWEEEWKLATKKYQREGVDFQDIDVSYDFKSLGLIPGITEEDLRYLKTN